MSLCVMTSQQSTGSGITYSGISENNTLACHPFSIYYSHWSSSLDLEKQLWCFSWQTKLNSSEVFINSIDFCALQLACLSHQLTLLPILETLRTISLFQLFLNENVLTSSRLNTSMLHIYHGTFLYKVDKQCWTPNYALLVTKLLL